MPVPPSAVEALAVTVRALAVDADALPVPGPLVDGWASVAALDYQAAVARLAVGVAHLRGALEAAASALEAPG